MFNSHINNKKALVLGLGISGRSAVELLLHNSVNVVAFDDGLAKIDIKLLSPLLAKGLIIKETIDFNMGQFDFVVVSPGIPQTHPLYQSAKSLGLKIIGEIELACQFLKTKNQPIIGITGTNGKTTVTLLIEHILNFAGKPAKALGNMGIPLSSECLKNDLTSQVYVVELSSYQLETLETKVLDLGIILNVTPDHLDRYRSMHDYALAKFLMQNCLKDNGKLWIENNCYNNYGYLLTNNCTTQIYGFNSNCNLYSDARSIYFNGFDEIKCPKGFEKKSHDLENILAAYGVCRELGVEPKDIIDAIECFKKPAHRIEFVKKIKNVSYYDDSKGTNIDAVIRAVESLNGDIVLIAGGVDKGSSYTPWIEAFANRVKCICAIGAASNKIKNELSHKIPVHQFETLENAIKYAANKAQGGDNVLLSPGCASFDMFRDYAHRGDEFKRIVNEFEKGVI